MAQGGSLGHLKFMQRAKLREEQKRKASEDVEAADESFFKRPGTSQRRCDVIVEGDPLPSAGNGRMSFQPSAPSAETSKSLDSAKAARDHASGQKTSTPT